MNLNKNLFVVLVMLFLTFVAPAGCASDDAKDRGDEYFTSGSKEADQRAEQRIAKDQQLKGENESAKEEKKSEDNKVEGKKPLYERLGGEQGLSAIVDDFVTRVLADPRVNWERKGVTRGGFSLNRNDSVSWDPNPQNVDRLKKHLKQFLALATGGPVKYEGRDMKEVHAGRHITNVEFDASIGD